MSENLLENGAQNGSVNGSESSPAEKESLLKIRDILFGAQVDEISSEIRRTEVDFSKQLGLLKSIQTRSTTALKDKVANHRIENRELVKTSISKLEANVQGELDGIKQKLEDLKARLQDFEGAMDLRNKEITAQFSHVNKSLESLDSLTSSLSETSVKKTELVQTLRKVAESLK